jgi:sugar phosphate isomerase/epimerase
MKLGFSNLAWPVELTGPALELLAAMGVTGVEVAPTRIADWDMLTSATISAYRNQLTAAGLQISSLQAIFFSRPEAQLLSTPAAFAVMAEHMKRVAAIAEALGAKAAVFGAPNNRHRGELSLPDAQSLAAERLAILGDICADANINLVMESVPATYGADFLLHAHETRDVVAKCQHPAIAMHLDTACVGLAGDDIVAEIGLTGSGLRHFHAAEPNIGPFDTPVCPHAKAASALVQARYTGWVVVEMREQPEPLAAIRTASAYLAPLYRG